MEIDIERLVAADVLDLEILEKMEGYDHGNDEES